MAEINRDLMPALILDKNVLQGLSANAYLQLATRFRLLMPDVLFFECLKGDTVERARCFAALPPVDNPIALTHDIGHHLRHEITAGHPLGRPSDHLVSFQYRFNPSLRQPETLPREVQQTIDEALSEHNVRVPTYFEHIRSHHRRIETIMADHGVSRGAAAGLIRSELTSLPSVRDALRDARDPEGRSFLPPVERLMEDSAIVVHFQVSHLMALQRALDHGGEYESDDNVARLTPSLSREVFDAHYLMMGVLENGLATREKRLRRIFTLLRPAGLLWPPAANETDTPVTDYR